MEGVCRGGMQRGYTEEVRGGVYGGVHRGGMWIGGMRRGYAEGYAEGVHGGGMQRG